MCAPRDPRSSYPWAADTGAREGGVDPTTRRLLPRQESHPRDHWQRVVRGCCRKDLQRFDLTIALGHFESQLGEAEDVKDMSRTCQGHDCNLLVNRGWRVPSLTYHRAQSSVLEAVASLASTSSSIQMIDCLIIDDACSLTFPEFDMHTVAQRLVESSNTLSYIKPVVQHPNQNDIRITGR